MPRDLKAKTATPDQRRALVRVGDARLGSIPNGVERRDLELLAEMLESLEERPPAWARATGPTLH